jgi:hypothetical protein
MLCVELMALLEATKSLHSHLTTYILKGILVSIYLLINYKYSPRPIDTTPTNSLYMKFLNKYNSTHLVHILKVHDNDVADNLPKLGIENPPTPLMATPYTFTTLTPTSYTILTHKFPSPTNNTSSKKSLPGTPFINGSITSQWTTTSPMFYGTTLQFLTPTSPKCSNYTMLNTWATVTNPSCGPKIPLPILLPMAP